jgi:hypothetical protein
MQDIVPASGHRPDAARRTPGGVLRINRFEDLRAGTYWRAKDDVPALLKPERRQRDVYLPADHPDYRKDGYHRDNVIGSEDYMVDVPIRSAMSEGRVHLVRSLKLVDGDVHAVVLQGHPSEGARSDRTYLVDEFLHFFELVDDAEAERVRQAEIAAIHQEISELQQAMIAGPPSEAPVALIGHQAKLPPKPTLGTMIANIGHIDALQATAERAIAVAQRQGEWVKTHTRRIGERTEALMPFYQERAAAAIATTESVVRYAQDLQKGVQSLGLYTGEGVEVRRLASGESAAPEDKLVFLRSVLAMDEEYLVNLQADGRSGGADHEDFDDFVEQLTRDPSLMQRVLPYPRMVVLMRYRRTDRIYFEDDSIQSAIANVEYNKPNRVQFLLIRDGDNLFQVWSELTTQSIPALFPTASMGDQAFRGVKGETIGIDDLNLSEAKGRFDDLVRVYKNLLILLWGLNDREGLFGPFYDPSTWTAAGFTDEDFQARHFRFWDPDGDALRLGTGRPSFRRWARAQNGWLRSGARVVAMRGMLASSPALGEHNDMSPRQPHAVRAIGDVAYEFVVRSTKKGHVVAVDGGRMVYPRERGRRAYRLEQTFDVPLDETDHGFSERGTLRWLCLDMIEAADIDHYLESRLDRPDYMSFYGLLLAVRDQIRIEEIEQRPIVAKLEAAYAAAPVPLEDGMDARMLARHAIRLWRAANRGAAVPAEGEAGHAAAYKALLGNMWTMAGNDRPIAEAEALAAEEGREPIRLVMTGRDRFALYATSVGDEREERLFDHVWVTRLACQRKSGRLKVTSKRVLEMPDAVADEETMHEWDAAATWKGRGVPAILKQQIGYRRARDPITYDIIRTAFDAAQSGSLEAFRTPPADLDAALAELNAARRRITTGRQVADLSYVQPFAIIRRTGFRNDLVPGFSARYTSTPVDNDYQVLSLQDDAFRMLHRLCSTDAERRKVANAFASQYEMKEVQIANFRDAASKHPTVAASSLSFWSKAGKGALGRDRSWRCVPLDANWSETLRRFDCHQIPHQGFEDGDRLWNPRLDEMTVWMDPAAPAILSELCGTHGWDAVPYVPEAMWPD